MSSSINLVLCIVPMPQENCNEVFRLLILPQIDATKEIKGYIILSEADEAIVLRMLFCDVRIIKILLP